MPVKAQVYIDGFNLYFGLKTRNWYKYYWLDLWALSEHLCQQRQLIGVKYFTADISGDLAKEKRQQQYLKALRIFRPSLQIIKGHYLAKPKRCMQCGHRWRYFEEKKTDVNIATHMLMDAFEDRFDVAILISGDSDLVPPIQMIKAKFPSKKILIACPPKRHSSQLCSVADAFFPIYENRFKSSLLPDPVIINNCIINKPSSWS